MADPPIIGQTANCIVCGRPARTWCGHVHRDDARVIAGFCAAHGRGIFPGLAPHPNGRPGCWGCLGDWIDSGGLLEEMPT